MRCILIIVAMIALTAGLVRAEDAPSSNAPASSEKGPNFPTPRRGPAFPATKSDQQHNRSFGAQAPTPQQRNVPLQAQPKTSSGQGWHTLPIGGGGWLYDLHATCDQGPTGCSPGVGTITQTVRTDVGGTGYWYNPATPNCGNAHRTGCWQAVLTPKNLPSVPCLNYGCGSISSVRAFGISSANTSVVYLYWGQSGCLFKSTTGPSGTYALAPGWTCNGYQETNFGGTGGNPYMLPDPYNENIVYVSDTAKEHNGGGFRSVDGGAHFASTNSLFPASGNTGYPTSIVYAFDKSNGTTSTCPTGTNAGALGLICTKNVFACSVNHGVYKSIDGGVTFYFLNSTGMPTGCRHIETDMTGTLYADDGNYPANVYKWVPSGANSHTTTGTWTQIVANGNGAYLSAIGVDPNTSCTLALQNCRVVAIDYAGNLNESRDSGAHWVGWNSNFTLTAPDAPWLALANHPYKVKQYDGLQTDVVTFDPTKSNAIMSSGGTAVWDTTPPGDATSPFVWTSRTVDINEIVVTAVTQPPNFNPVAGGWDRGSWSLQSKTVYPSTYQYNITTAFSRAYGIEYSNDFTGPGTGAVVSYNFGGCQDPGGANSFPPRCTGYTGVFVTNNPGNGDPTNWSNVPARPEELDLGFASRCNCMSGGDFIPLTATNWLWLLGKGWDIFGTVDAGAHWQKVGSTGALAPVAGMAQSTSASGTSATLTFSAASGQLDAAFLASIAAGNSTRATDVTNNWCGLGTIGSATSSSITLTAPAACSVANGDYIFFFPAATTGWTLAGTHPGNLTPDRAQSNVAYVSSGTTKTGANGIYKIYLSGGVYNAVQVYSGQVSSVNMWQTGGALLIPPTTAGDVYFSNSTVGMGGALVECTDSQPSGTSAGTMTCQPVDTSHNIPGTSTKYGAAIANVWNFAAGKTKPGANAPFADYSAIYFYGDVNGHKGIWQTYDHFRTFTQIGGDMFQGCGNAGACVSNNGDMFPGRFDSVGGFAASPDTQGLVYICFGGTACLYGQFN
jgi:hypothetical protein